MKKLVNAYINTRRKPNKRHGKDAQDGKGGGRRAAWAELGQVGTPFGRGDGADGRAVAAAVGE